jgi:hypothetical protein
MKYPLSRNGEQELHFDQKKLVAHRRCPMRTTNNKNSIESLLGEKAVRESADAPGNSNYPWWTMKERSQGPETSNVNDKDANPPSAVARANWIGYVPRFLGRYGLYWRR